MIYLNLLHQLMWPFLSKKHVQENLFYNHSYHSCPFWNSPPLFLLFLTTHFSEQLKATIYQRPLEQRPVQPWSLVNQRIAVPTNSSRFRPQINNQGGQGRVYPSSVYPWYLVFIVVSIGILGDCNPEKIHK